MSYSSSSSISHGVSSGQSGCYIVPPQAIQSAISIHQHESARTNKAPRGIKSLEFQIEYETAAAAYFNGKISAAEFNAVQKRVMDAGREYDRRFTDYLARTQAGETEPGDFWKEFDGCTNEEAEGRVRQRARASEIQRANETRSQSRLVGQGRHGRGH